MVSNCLAVGERIEIFLGSNIFGEQYSVIMQQCFDFCAKHECMCIAVI